MCGRPHRLHAPGRKFGGAGRPEIKTFFKNGGGNRTGLVTGTALERSALERSTGDGLSCLPGEAV